MNTGLNPSLGIYQRTDCSHFSDFTKDVKMVCDAHLSTLQIVLKCLYSYEDNVSRHGNNILAQTALYTKDSYTVVQQLSFSRHLGLELSIGMCFKDNGIPVPRNFHMLSHALEGSY